MFNEEKTQYILPYLSLVILPLYSVKCFIAETFNVLKSLNLVYVLISFKNTNEDPSKI